jgi:hypothetical protein
LLDSQSKQFTKVIIDVIRADIEDCREKLLPNDPFQWLEKGCNVRSHPRQEQPLALETEGEASKGWLWILVLSHFDQ